VTTQPPTSAPLLGEPLAVEFMNTIWADRRGVHDALASDAEVLAWLRAVDPRLPPRSAGVDAWLERARPADLADAGDRLRRLRNALRRVAADQTADPRPAAASAIEDVTEATNVLNEAAAAAPHWSSLERTAAGFARGSGTDAPPGTAIAALVAEDAIGLFTGGLREELRACLAPGCVLYFVRQHPRREWCSTACGNRARAARHYQRHRSASGDHVTHR
jgi:predicted RNA-binding Zn ribbon-like protein